jgi:hypothetical protein
MIAEKPFIKENLALSDEDFMKPFLELNNQAKLFETMQNQ